MHLPSPRVRMLLAQKVVARCAFLVLEARARRGHGRGALEWRQMLGGPWGGHAGQIRVHAQGVVGTCEQGSQSAWFRRQVECGEEDTRGPRENSVPGLQALRVQICTSDFLENKRTVAVQT